MRRSAQQNERPNSGGPAEPSKAGLRKLRDVTLALAFGLIVIELALSLLGWLFPAAGAMLAPPDSQPATFMVEDPVLEYRPSPSFPDHDSRGFRNARALDRAEIVALGDSQTYGNGVEPDEAWPQQLAGISGLTTYNISFGGYGPTHSLELFSLAMELRPRLVIAAFYAGNDLWDAYHMVHDRGQLPELMPDDETLIGAIREAEREGSLAARFERLTRLYGRGVPESSEGEPSDATGTEEESEEEEAPPSSGGNVVRRVISEHSKLYGLARALWHARRGRLDADEEWTLMLAIAEATGGQWQVLESAVARTVIVPRYRSAALDLDDPRIREGLRLSLAALDRMRNLSDAAGARFLVLLIPTKPLVFAALFDQAARNGDYANLVSRETEMWRLVKERLEQLGIDHLDTLDALRGTLARGEQPYPASQDGHPNAVGQRAIAELVAEWFASLPPQ